MRRGVIIVGFVLCAAPASACEDLRDRPCRLAFTERHLPRLQAPSKEKLESSTYSDLLKDLRDASANRQAAEQLRQRRDDLKRELSRLNEEPSSFANLWGVQTRRSIRATSAQLDRLDAPLGEAERLERASMNKAIDSTIDFYGLRPGVTVAPPYPGLQAGIVTPHPWDPYFSRRQTQDPLGRDRLYTQQELDRIARGLGAPRGARIAVDARTDINTGGVRIYPDVLIRAMDASQPRPGLIASTIYHEMGHWLDAAARSRIPTPLESFESEQRAYRRQIANAAVFGLDSDEVSELKTALSVYEQLAIMAGTLTWGQFKDRFPNVQFALSIDSELAAAGDAAEEARIAAERAFAQQQSAPLAPASFVPSHAAPNLSAPYATEPSPDQRARMPLLAARETSDREVLAMVIAACRGDWGQTTQGLLGYAQLEAHHVALLENQAASRPEGCERNMLLRLVAMRRSRELLDLARLQSETSAASVAHSDADVPLDQDPRGSAGNRGGVTPGDRPSQRGAQRRLGDGWKGF